MLKVSKYKQDKNIVSYIALNLFIFFASVYFLTASGLNFYHTDASQLRLYVVKSIVERADLTVPKIGGIKGADGRYYSWVGIGSALLAVPFYVVGKMIGNPEVAVSLMNQLFGAATGVLIFLFAISLGYSRRASLLVAVFFGLGTIAWPLAKQPFDHIIETFFILLSVYFVYQHSVNKRGSYLTFSAFSIGFAFITRLTSILVIPPLFIFLFMSYVKEYDLRGVIKSLIKDVVLFSIAFLPFVCLSLWYNYYRFGSVFETGYELVSERTGLSFFTGTPLLTGLSGFLISPGKGYFYYSPIAVLFFFSILSFLKKYRWLGISFIFVIISYLLFLSKNIYWHGDWAWGPRYILVLTPFFVIPIAEVFESTLWKKKLLRVVVYSILAVSIIIQIAAVSVDFQKYFLVSRFIEKENFTIAQGSGVQTIIEPPDEIYRDWKKSPLVAQFVSLYTIARGMESYRHVDMELKEDACIEERMKANPYMNVFDFWWLYNYYETRSYSWLFMALICLIITIYAATRLRKMSYKI